MLQGTGLPAETFMQVPFLRQYIVWGPGFGGTTWVIGLWFAMENMTKKPQIIMSPAIRTREDSNPREYEQGVNIVAWAAPRMDSQVDRWYIWLII